MLSESLLQYLADNISDLTFDKTGTTGNLFDNALPDKPDIAVMLENTGGFPRDMRNKNYKLVIYYENELVEAENHMPFDYKEQEFPIIFTNYNSVKSYNVKLNFKLKNNK